VKASIFINYKKYRNKFSSTERSEEASFDTEQSTFIKEAEPLIVSLAKLVENARLKRR
jgi:hypothetical protein